ncbi:hypothetical protein HDV03_000584 [Kappamyces sp. JEL0829]|nr:hypothetical protein HDV03_000584 [Kappamyces sp. JEL0829]
MPLVNPTYTPRPSAPFKTLQSFYPYYLGEHANQTCRRLHVIGTTGVVGLTLYAAATATLSYLALVPVCGYGFAWVGHFFFEKNKPATFRFPLYSLASDFIMWFEIVSLQRPF